MKIKGIRKDKCTICGECIHECPPELFRIEQSEGGEKQVVYNDSDARCMYCGHCVAVCKADAIDYESEEKLITFEGIDKPETIVGFDTLAKFFFARRSVRRFTKESVTEETIGKILAVMRSAPSASNKQSWEYIVITDPAARDRIARHVLSLFKAVRMLHRFRWLIMPFMGSEDRKLMSSKGLGKTIDRTIADYARGKDRVFFGAPCIIVLHSPAYGHMSGNDAGIALTLGMGAAQSLGLGTCWIGFAEEAFARNRKMRAEFGIPKGHHVYGVLALGYPAVRFHRVPVRKPLKVRWM